MSPVGYEHLKPEWTAVRMATYAALAEHHRREPLPEDLRRVPLTRWEARVFSQNGEDGVLAELLRRTGTGPRFFCEFGVSDGAEFCCRALAELHGWSGLVMEADPELHARLALRAQAWPGVATAQAWVKPNNVAELMAAVPKDLDVLVIDVDGADYWIWMALADWRPRIVVVEYNAALPLGEALVQPPEHKGWDGTDYFGASATAFEDLGFSRGYRLVHTDLTGTNLFLVREDLGAELPDRDVVPVHPPDYLLSGMGHKPHPKKRRYVRP